MPKMMAEPCPPPTCALCDVELHATQNFPDFPILRTHMSTVVEIDDAVVVNIPTIPMVKNKLLGTNHPCAVCGLYGHYSHHLPKFLKNWSLLSDLRKNFHKCEIIFLEEIHPSASSSNTHRTIYTISTSSSPFSSLIVKYPIYLSWHHFCNDEEIP